MPASITHELIARECLKLLPAPAADAACRTPDYYFLGAQGPDLFFFHAPFRRDLPNLGKSLHRNRLYEWCSAMLLALRTLTGDAFGKCLAYSLGFGTHIASDALFHPYVYGYLERKSGDPHRHQEIESGWDAYFLSLLDGERVRDHRDAFDLGVIAGENVLSPFLIQTGSFFGQTLRPASLRAMYRRFSLYLHHTRTSRCRPLSLFGFRALYPPKAAAHDPNEDVFLSAGKETSQSLFAHAVTDAAESVSAFLEAFNADMPLPKELFARHLLTGERQ